MVTSADGGNLLLQHRVTARRSAVGIPDEQDDRGDVAPRGFFHEADFLGHLEELVEGVETEIDHLGDAVIDDQPVHQRHLAEGIDDLGGLGHLRQVFEQRRLFQVDVEGGDRRRS